MSSPFKLTIITPQGAIFDESVVSVSVPGQEGSFGVLNRHAPIVAQLTEGVIRVGHPDGMRYFAAGAGILEVDHRTNCLILVDYAHSADSKEAARSLLHQSR